MWLRSLALALALASPACAVRTQPYRFASPMLGMANLPPPELGERPAPEEVAPPPEDPLPREEPARASAVAAAAVVRAPIIRQLHELQAPHRLEPDSLAPPARSPLELRGLVGRRDRRDPTVAALAWARALGGPAILAADAAGVVAWAQRGDRLRAPVEPAEPGDLLVFGRTRGDDPVDLVAVVVARDARGVTEYVYLGGGVVRRGFVDPARPALRRDANGAVVNTFLRHVKRYPPKGTRYLAGELLVHVVRR